MDTNKTLNEIIKENNLNSDFVKQVEKLIAKNQRAQAREDKKKRLEKTKVEVLESLNTLLKKPGATVKHRTVWLAVGKENYTRDEVLNALRSLREDGVLQNIRTSNNNFQVFWAFVNQESAQIFGTINDVK